MCDANAVLEGGDVRENSRVSVRVSEMRKGRERESEREKERERGGGQVGFE